MFEWMKREKSSGSKIMDELRSRSWKLDHDGIRQLTMPKSGIKIRDVIAGAKHLDAEDFERMVAAAWLECEPDQDFVFFDLLRSIPGILFEYDPTSCSVLYLPEREIKIRTIVNFARFIDPHDWMALVQEVMRVIIVMDDEARTSGHVLEQLKKCGVDISSVTVSTPAGENLDPLLTACRLRCGNSLAALLENGVRTDSLATGTCLMGLLNVNYSPLVTYQAGSESVVKMAHDLFRCGSPMCGPGTWQAFMNVIEECPPNTLYIEILEEAISKALQWNKENMETDLDIDTSMICNGTGKYSTAWRIVKMELISKAFNELARKDVKVQEYAL